MTQETESETRMLFSQPMPLRSEDPELQVQELAELARLDARLAELQSERWAVKHRNTNENVDGHTYVVWYTLIRSIR